MRLFEFDIFWMWCFWMWWLLMLLGVFLIPFLFLELLMDMGLLPGVVLYLWQRRPLVLLMLMGLGVGLVLGLGVMLGLLPGMVLGLGVVNLVGLWLVLRVGPVQKRSSKGYIHWLAKVLPEDWRAELQALRYQWRKKRHPEFLLKLRTVLCLLGMLKALIQIKVENTVFFGRKRHF